MSRYEFVPEGWPARYSLAIGWDEPLAMYFAQVMDHSIDQEDNSVIVWLGVGQTLNHDLDDMLWTLNSRIFCLPCIESKLSGVVLTELMRARLSKDRKRGPSAKRQTIRRKPMFALDLFPPEKAE